MTAQAVSPRVAYRHTRRDQGGDAVLPSYGQGQQAASGGVTIAWHGCLRQACWAVVLVTLSIAGLRLPAQAQLLRPFTVQFTDNKPGDIYIIGNTQMSCDPATAGLERQDAISPASAPEDPIPTLQVYTKCDPNIAKTGAGFINQGGTLTPATGIYLSDQGYSMIRLNRATQPGINNSSSAEWVLPPGATVLWAGLYWSARPRRNTSLATEMLCGSTTQPPRTAPERVCFKTPTSSTYQLKTGTLGPDRGPNDVYQNFVDVTQDVHAGGSGTYSVADMDTEVGNDGLGFFAGWALVIVIRDPREPLRNLTVFNGFAHVNGNDQSKPNLTTVTIPVTGFLTPQVGPVTTHLGVVSYEGDLGSTGDTIKLNGQQLGDAVHVPDNFFNSGISRLGTSITGNRPDFINQLGFDIAVVDAPGILPNGATSATFQFFSAAEIYYPGVFTFATDLFLPVVEAFKTVQDTNGVQALPGDVLEYTIVLTNIGNDGAVNQVLTDPIPAGAAYVPGSLRIAAGANAGVLTDAPGDDVAEFNSASNSVVFRLGTGATLTAGGTLAPGQSTTVVFRVQINDMAPPASVISDQAVATYNSQTLPNLPPFEVRSDSNTTTPGKLPTDVTVGEARTALTLHKSAAPDPVIPGELLTYTLEVTNVGPTGAFNVVLEDATPLHTTFVSATVPLSWIITESPAVGGTGPIIFTRVFVPLVVPTAPLMFTIVVQVDPAVPSGTFINNLATLTSPSDPDPDTAATIVRVGGDLDLSITKTDGQTLTVPGAVLTYTLVVRNAGPNAVTRARVTDPVPATLLGVTWTCAASEGSRCPASGTGAIDVLVDLLGEGTATFTLSATVDPAAQGGTIGNEATVTVPPGTMDPNPGNNTTIDNNRVIVEADIAVLKTVNNATPQVGQTVIFTVTATNNGPNPATGVQLSDGVPPGLTFVSATPSQGTTYTPTTGVWDIGALVLNAQATLMLEVLVEQAGLIRNVATKIAGGQFDPNTSNNSSGVDLTSTPVPVPEADIEVRKIADTLVPPVGTAVTFTVTVTNRGPSAASGVAITDLLPAGLVLVSATPGQGTYTAATGVWAIGALQVNAQATLTLVAQVVQAGRTRNVATKTAGDQFDPNVANNSDFVDLTNTPVPVPEADIEVRKIADTLVPPVGTAVTFTVTVTNRGPSAASGVAITDLLPAGLVLVSATPGQGTYTAATGVWAIGALPFKAQATLTLVAQVVQAGRTRNVATKTAGDQLDPNVANNSDFVDLTNTSAPGADIEVRKIADTRVPPVGTAVTFTVTATNKGPSAASGVAITDLLPAGLAFVSATPVQGSYTPATGVWTIGALAVGAQTTLTLQATVQEAGEFTNRAAKTAQGELDPNPSNDVSGVTINGEAADVQVVKTVDRTIALVGETVTFTVTVTNNGPSAVSGVEVLDVLSARLTDVSATPSQGTYSVATGRWSVGALAAVGAAATATLQVTATVAEPGPLTNLAVKIDQDQPDPNPANDRDSIAPPGLPVADLVVTKSNGVDRVAPGTEVLYTVLVTNRGPSPVTGATVSDPIPLILRDQGRGLRAFEGPTWTCMASAGSACPVGGTGNVLATVDLLVGGTATFTLRGLVTPTDVGTVVNAATVTAPAEVLDPLPGNNSAIDTDRLTPLADLSITKTDEVQSVVPGTAVRYTLVVRNAGPSTVLNARVQDPASAALMGVQWTCVASAGSSCPAEGSGPLDTTVTLAPGGTVTFTLTGTVTADAMGMLANTATVTPPSGVTDPELDNNTVTDTNAVLPPAAFRPPSGRKTVQEGAFPDLEWRVVWRNIANAVPLRIRVLDPIPVATTYVDGSVTCMAGGQSTVARCDFDAETNQLVYDGIVGPDPGATTEAQAANAVIITFRTAVLPGVTQVANQALAHWDETGTGTVNDDISAGQVPVRTGTEFGGSDPTVATLPALACLFQQRLLALDLTGPAPAAGGPPDTTPTDGQDPGVDSGTDRQNVPGTDGILTLSTPLDGDTVAGTTVTLAALRGPVSGTVVSQPVAIRIANAAPADTLDLVENVGSKTERVPARETHNVLTADGVGVEFPVTALAAADILRLERVDPTTAPGQLPGVAVSPLVAVTLAGGGTAFSGSVTLSLPYPDTEPDGLVDGTSPAVPELTLTAWSFNTARGIWVHLPEARVFPAFHEVLVSIAQPGLYGVFQAADGRTGLAGTLGPASQAPRSAGAQGSGWQDIGEVTTFPFLVPLNTTTLPNGTYEVRTICAATPADLRAAAGSAPTTSTVLGTSGGGGGGGCSLRPGGGWSRATALDTVGNLGLPLVVLLVLGLWAWRRPR